MPTIYQCIAAELQVHSSLPAVQNWSRTKYFSFARQHGVKLCPQRAPERHCRRKQLLLQVRPAPCRTSHVFMGSVSQSSESCIPASAAGVAPPRGRFPLAPCAKALELGSKFQGITLPYGQLPWHPPGGFTVSHEAWHLPMDDFLSTALQVACKQVLEHLLMHTTPAPREFSGEGHFYCTSPLMASLSAPLEDGFPMNPTQAAINKLLTSISLQNWYRFNIWEPFRNVSLCYLASSPDVDPQRGCDHEHIS